MNRFPLLPASITGLLFLIGSLTAAADESLERARTLHAGGQARDAFELLQAEEARRAGEPAFDYLLGIAALDAGQPLRAVFALERVVASQPDNSEARAELARAYYALGDSEAAKREFERVVARRPPAAVMSVINRYLSAIEERLAAAGEEFWGYLEIGLGHDSNANSATERSQVAVPVLGGTEVNLSPSGRQSDAWFTEAKGGLRFGAPLRSDLRLIASADLTAHVNQGEAFDQETLDGSLGLLWLKGINQYTLALQGQKYLVGDATYRNLAGLQGQWQKTLDDRNQFTLFGQLANARYPTQSVRDNQRRVAGAGWAHAVDLPGEPVLFVSAYGGTEKQRRTTVRDDLSRDLWGVRLGGQYTLNRKTTLFANATYEHSAYGKGSDPTFLVRRKDDYVSVNAGANYQLSERLRITPQLLYINNDANIVVNDYQRLVAQINARWEFR